MTIHQLQINGITRTVDADGDTPLLWVVRDVLGLTGTKFGCGMGLCGACTIHIDGVAQRACITPLEAVGQGKVTTIEAIADSRVGKQAQLAWLELDVVQCGYCQPGQLMSATALLASNSAPSDADIDAAMAGNICRCGTYERIRAGIKAAATALRRPSSGERA